MNHHLLTKAAKAAFSGEMIAIGSLVVYLFTLAPGVYGFDSAEFASGAFSLGIVHPPGFPLYMLVGKLFSLLPFGSVAYRLNFMSAFFAALTIYVLYRVITKITARAWIAWISSAFLAFSIYFWNMSVVAEVYTLHTFFLILEIFVLLIWRENGKRSLLVLFTFIFGLSLTNHTTGLLFAPGFALMIASSPKWEWRIDWLWALMICSFLLGLLVYIYIPIRANSDTPLNYIKDYYSIDVSTFSGLLWMVSGKAYHFFAFGYHGSEILQQLLNGFESFWRNFMGVGCLIGIPGIIVSFRKDWKTGLALSLIFLGNFIFYTNYRVLDKDTMFLPAYTIFTVFIAFGLDFLDHLLHQVFKNSDFHILTLYAHPIFWSGLCMLALVLNWQWADMSKALGPETYSNMIMQAVENDATIIASWSPAVVLEYYQIVEGKRTDLRIYNQSRSEVASYYKYWSIGKTENQISLAVSQEELAAIDKIYENSNLYSIDYDPVIAGGYEYIPVGTFYRLEKKDSTEKWSLSNQ